MFGVDYSQGYDIPSLVNAGVKFVCRYIGFTDNTLPQDKIIVYKESYDLAKAGLSIVSNWEWTADRASINNSFYNGNPALAHAGGIEDAVAAIPLHRSIGGPDNRPIYFSVDFNTNGKDCVDYFKGLISVLGLKRVGAYGPYEAVKFLMENNLIAWAWQTYAWSDGQWFAGSHIEQTQNGVSMGKMVVDYDISMASDFGQWTLPVNPPKPVWYQYHICVPFGNTNFDSGLNGSHNLDVAAEPNMPVTSIVSGSVSSITSPQNSPDWGLQVGVLLDKPINSVRWFHYMHMSAVNPKLALGSRVAVGDLVGWVGGANTDAQYLGTTNPTGHNFLNSPNASSRVQQGIALMDGPSYGGIGWVDFPPIDLALDPTPILQKARNSFLLLQPTPAYQYAAQKTDQFNSVWASMGVDITSPLAQVFLDAYVQGKIVQLPFPVLPATPGNDWGKNQGMYLSSNTGHYAFSFNGVTTLYDASNHAILSLP